MPLGAPPKTAMSSMFRIHQGDGIHRANVQRKCDIAPISANHLMPAAGFDEDLSGGDP